ncbi:MAG: glycogen debranching protein GlgX [Chthoniobacteraceae bacterium]
MAGKRAVWPGQAYPLGATLTSEGVNFAVFSQHAKAVYLCLFDSPDGPHEERLRLHEGASGGVWHGFVPGLKAGQLYGFRANRKYDPKHGHRCNSAKLLLDPYAHAITGGIRWCPEMLPYKLSDDRDRDLQSDQRDNAFAMPKCVVVDPAFDWSGETRPATPLADSVIYEVHVKGFSKLHPEIPEHLRGTYAALGSEPAIAYFKKFGITAVELLPVHHFVNDGFLEERGLTNYWGYSSIGFFAPHHAYAGDPRGGQVAEFKSMVKALHAAGIEVILDVVYNHTGEGNHLGPALCFRGLDNANYYWPAPTDPRHVMDFTGCGNSLNMPHPRVLQLIMDSLRYWVLEMHVDGFRFDLATTLGRERHGFDHGSGFFDILRQDPVLSQVKLIAEPWDLGHPDSYQVGGFPEPFAEWNGKYRDSVRAYWKGDEGMIGEFANRLTGSSDLYQHAHRPPSASINFITAHDGFTLADLVAYNEKHNEANGEEGRDGDSHNRSWNCGAEGATDDAEINALRRRQRRNFLATLLLSQGVPMISAGDEYGRTQRGNNNAYCQDNELSWLSWLRSEEERQFEDFVVRLVAFRHAHPIFRRRKFFSGRKIPRARVKDIIWIDADGMEMNDSRWTSSQARCIGVVLVGPSSDAVDAQGRTLEDSTFMLLFNAHHEPVKFRLAGREGVGWRRLLDTRDEAGFLHEPDMHAAGDDFEIEARSLCLFELATGTPEDARAATWKPREPADE